MAAGRRRVSEVPAPIHLEMGYTTDEFASVLPLAMRDWRVTGRSPGWTVIDGDGEMLAEIAIAPRPERALGALRLPVLQVQIRFHTTLVAKAAELQRRFERGFQRGGG